MEVPYDIFMINENYSLKKFVLFTATIHYHLEHGNRALYN